MLAPEAICLAGDPSGPPKLPPKQGDNTFEKKRGAWQTAIALGGGVEMWKKLEGGVEML